jgi:hypothetical protein
VLVPVLLGKLTGDQGGADIESVIQDLQQIALLLIGQWRHTQVIQDQQVGFRKLAEQLGVASVAFGNG